MKKYVIPSYDQYPLHVHTFDTDSPAAVVQIIHGMEEHQERYEDFAKFLNANGYSVVTSNLRGHGSDAKYSGYFKDKKGAFALIQDQKYILKWIEKQYNKIPVILFAHSMGTIISRVLLQTESQRYQKVILSGYPNFHLSCYPGILLANATQMIHGAKYKSKFLQNTSVGIFNKLVKNAKTSVDWICTDKKVVNSYLADPYCGIGFTCSAFRDLHTLVIRMHHAGNYKNVAGNLPILLLRGNMDPCVGGNTGAFDSFLALHRAGFHNITRIAYPKMRHEILNEKNHKKVYEDILNFCRNN